MAFETDINQLIQYLIRVFAMADARLDDCERYSRDTTVYKDQFQCLSDMINDVELTLKNISDYQITSEKRHIRRPPDLLVGKGDRHFKGDMELLRRSMRVHLCELLHLLDLQQDHGPERVILLRVDGSGEVDVCSLVDQIRTSMLEKLDQLNVLSQSEIR